MHEDPFARSRFLRGCAFHEFRYFKDLIRPHLEAYLEQTPGLPAFRDHLSLYVRDEEEDRLQISFGNRSMGLPTIDGTKTASEGKAGLVYAIGLNGDIIVSVYPTKSDYAEANEDLIILRIGYYSGYQLSRMVKRDLKQMVAYAYVTSADAEATWFQTIRYWWLRWWQPTNKKGAYVRAGRWTALRSMSWFLFKATVNTSIKIGLPALIFAALAYYNREDIIQWLQQAKH